MNPRRNDPCPCGSGKKYKKCCLLKKRDADSFILGLNNLYALVKTINTQLIAKSNKSDYSIADFNDAMDLAITSNALSLIKAVIQDNYCSITNLLNIRNIIEHHVLMLMDESGDISDTQKELFNEQYKLIEYKSYKDNKLILTGTVIDPEQMEQNYLSAKSVFIKHGFSESKVKAFLRTRVPFLCDKDFNFNSAIKKYCPDFEDAYIYLSRRIHPSTYYDPVNTKYVQNIIMVIVFMLTDRYTKQNISSKMALPYFEESRLVYGTPQLPSFGQALFDIQKRQWKITMNIADFFAKKLKKDNYVSCFFREVSMVIHDINTDSQLGYCENTKLKFKAIAEMFACFDKTYFQKDPNQGQAAYLLMDIHEVLKDYEMHGKDAPADILEKAFGRYKEAYPNSEVSIDDFSKSFKKSTGFLIDENGKCTTLCKLVSNFIEALLFEIKNTERGENFIELYKLLYYESQNMSHGCGYLYFANQGAWSEDINVILFLDKSIQYVLGKFCMISAEYQFSNKENNDFLELFLTSTKEMTTLVEAKNKIFSEVPRVGKTF